jgi:hypothetical protein
LATPGDHERRERLERLERHERRERGERRERLSAFLSGRRRRRGIAGAALLVLAFAVPWGWGLAPAPAAAQETRDILGVAHVAGKYSFGSEDFLNEGADELLDLGTRVIKVWFTPDAVSRYPFNSHWGPTPANLVELARKPYYQALFAKPFTTFILVFQAVNPAPPSVPPFPWANVEAERQQLHDLAAYLLTTYAGSGKTFILQNWEGDHLLRAGLAPDARPSRQRVFAMALWWDAHQDGVAAARAEVGARGVNVYHAIEVNALADAMRGEVTAANDVLPWTHADLYSYSSWDVDFDPNALTQALDYLQSKAPPSALFGRRNIYLGEFGEASNQAPDEARRADVIRRLAETALGWGVRYAVYWQLYCNEPARSFTGRPGDGDVRGFWLIRPDGVKAGMWYDLKRLLPTSFTRLALRAASGQYVSGPGPLGGALEADAWTLGPWQVFSANVWSGQPLASGEVVYLQSHNGMYVHPAHGPLRPLVAADWDPERSQGLLVRKVSGDGPIGDGDLVTLQTSAGMYVTADPRGGAVLASRLQPGAAAVFRVERQD